MAIAVMQEWTATDRRTKGYEAVSNEIRSRVDGPIEGFLFHAAGFDGDTFRIFEVWDSAEQLERFNEEVLMPAVRAAMEAGSAFRLL